MTEFESDDLLDRFLAFLDQQMQARPDLIRPLTSRDIDGLDELLDGVEVEPDEDLGDFTLP